MAQPAQLIGDLRVSVNELLDSLDKLEGVRRQWDALGGMTFVEPFFEANTGYDFNALNMADALTSVQAIEDLLAADGGGHQTNLNTVR